MSKKLPYPEGMEKRYPPGAIPEKRKIIRCSRPDTWYSIGDIITVHYFATYGCWDTEGRWIDYYDLSEPIADEPKPKSFFKKLFG